MNRPEIYLVEPYNAYAQKDGKKKHWHQIVEEEALMQRIIAEAESRTLPPQSPDISTPTVGNAAGNAPGAPGGNAAGGGGNPPPQAYHPENASVSFDRSPASGAGPLTVQFINHTVNPELYSYLWSFGDGTYSTDVNPVHVYQSGSDATNVYTASLQATMSLTNTPATISVPVYTSASKPTISVSFTLSGSGVTLSGSYYTASAGSTVSFVNASAQTNGLTPTYSWNFGSGSNSTSSLANPTYVFTAAGNYTVLLGATGSYGIESSGARLVQVV